MLRRPPISTRSDPLFPYTTLFRSCWQTIPRLVNLVGPARAKQIVLLGEKMSAAKAQEWGIVDFVVPDGAARKHALELAERISGMPDAAVRMSKQSINAYANALNHVSSRSEERRVGKECVSTCRSRWSPYH